MTRKNILKAALSIVALSSLLGGCVAPIQRTPEPPAISAEENQIETSGSWELKRNSDGTVPNRLGARSARKSTLRQAANCPDRRVLCLFGGEERCEADSLGCKVCTCVKTSDSEAFPLSETRLRTLATDPSTR